MNRFRFALLPALAFATPALAEGPLKISANVRARVEMFDGTARANARSSDAVLLLRSELLAEYDFGGVRIGGELIDSRVYFDDRDTLLSTSEVNPLEPSQAWVAVDLGPHTTVQLGRFHLNLGSRRLLSRNGYRNTVNSFTGARLDLQSANGAATTLFWTMPQNRLPDDPEGLHANRLVLDRERDELQTFGGYLTNQPTPLGLVDLFAVGLTERDAPDYQTRNRHLVTIGGRVRVAPRPGRFDYEIEGAWQGGRARGSTAQTDTLRRSVDAGTVQIIAGYSFQTAWSPRLVASLDYASGDGRGAGVGRYDSLYGSRSFEFGVTSLFGAVARSNLISPSLRLEAAPDKRWRTHLAVRPLWLAKASDSFGTTNVRDPLGQSGRFAGTQVDTRIQYWLVPERVQAGMWLAWLDKGRFLREAPNAPAGGHSLYAATEIIFRF
ncbi:MAG: alginate export family protein [Sphingomonas bacterium]|nr:alginate export family protein [Sphingomonas bacterium]